MRHSDAGIDEAKKLLEQAIALHEKHMNGTEPTTGPAGDASQMKMMRMMTRALAALRGVAAGKMGGGLLGM